MSKKKRQIKRKVQKKAKLKPQQIVPAHIKEHLDRAVHAQSIGDVRTAESLFRELIDKNSKVPMVYCQLATICAMSGRVEEAKLLWNKALQLDGRFLDALMGLGDIFRFEQQFQKSLNYYKKVITLKPDFAQAHLNLSISLFLLGELDDAETVCKKSIKLAPALVQAKQNLAQILIMKGDRTQAQQIYLDILAVTPTDVTTLYELGNLLKADGKLEEASEYYRQVMQIKADYSPAHLTYSSIHKYQSDSDEQLQLMLQQSQNKSLSVDNKIHFSFALAKAYEDIKQYHQAFKFLAQGNRLRFESFNYQVEADATLIQNIIQTFTKESLSQIQINGNNSAKPIFVIGMPRSGTTLVERILSSHSDVHGAGELGYFFQLGTSHFLGESTNYLFNPLDSYPLQSFQQIGKTYLEQIQPINEKALHIVDKMPFNMLLIGLIKIALPNAKIVHCVRDAKDNCLSIFKQYFATDNYQFAYDQKSLGQYHNQYRLLMKHWHQVMPDTIIDVRYESLVQNPAEEIPRLITACDLEWQDDCMNFNQKEGVVKTASAYQVRQPIYTSSVSLCKAYEEHLGPLLDELERG